MTDLILILSRCQKKTKLVRSKEIYYRFHFKGFYLGNKVAEVHVHKAHEQEFEIGADYLLWVKNRSYLSGILKVNLIKSKKI